MRLATWLFSVALTLSLVPPASAGLGIFSRKPKIDPAEHVPALIMQLKTDKDEVKRTNAADELRNFDPKAFPEMMTVLSDALLKDASPAVRSEAASTIAKLRPINQQAGYALEQAAANDPSMRVRMAARQSLWQYNLLGYRSAKPAETAVKAPPTAPPPQQPKTHTSAKNPRTKESPEPPLADAPVTPPASPPRPLKPPSKITPIRPVTPQTGDQQGPSLGAPG